MCQTRAPPPPPAPGIGLSQGHAHIACMLSSFVWAGVILLLARRLAREMLQKELDVLPKREEASEEVVRVESVLQQISTDSRTRGPLAKRRHTHALQLFHQLYHSRVGGCVSR